MDVVRNFSTWQPLEEWELCVSSKTQEWHQRKSYHFEISKPEHFLWLKPQHLKSPKHPRRSLPCIGGFETMEYGIIHLSEWCFQLTFSSSFLSLWVHSLVDPQLTCHRELHWEYFVDIRNFKYYNHLSQLIINTILENWRLIHT